MTRRPSLPHDAPLDPKAGRTIVEILTLTSFFPFPSVARISNGHSFSASGSRISTSAPGAAVEVEVLASGSWVTGGEEKIEHGNMRGEQG